MHSPPHHLFLPLLLSRLPSTFAAASTGDISLWSDSSCQPGESPSFSLPDPIALNHTLAADSCYTLPNAAHSYIVNSRPTCSDGSIAGFAYYNGQDCRKQGFGPALNNDRGDGGYTTYDGLCLALVEINSLAFLCKGVDEKGDGKSTATITVLDAEGTGVATVVTSTMGGSVMTSAAAVAGSGSSSSSPPSRSSPSTTSRTLMVPVATPLYPLPTTGMGALPTGTGTAVGTGGFPLGSMSSSIPFNGAGKLAFGGVTLFGVVGFVGFVVNFLVLV
ncbi:MAG: hypothetical protein LQ350_007721 [Teloschistes chrysophthalmus]|nr:MAG: hypothetical protein LQ350_007721 [Niorma chrysophthalma]